MLQTNEPLDQTDTKTNEAGNHEQQQKRLTSDSTNKGIDPADSSSHQRRDRGNNLRQENTPLQTNQPFDQADTEANKAHDHKHENQRIAGNSTNKGADPRDRAGDKRTNIVNDSSKGTSSRSRRR